MRFETAVVSDYDENWCASWVWEQTQKMDKEILP